MLRQLVSKLMDEVNPKDLLAHVERLSECDRFQASRGIQRAAAYVADVASRIGLESVLVEQFPADGKPHWWSYKAPVSWTPTKAQLLVALQDSIPLEIDHVARPMSLATYSAPTPICGVTATLVNVHAGTLLSKVRGTIAVLSNPTNIWLKQIAAAGAVGFIAAFDESEERSRRIELEPDSSIFGFSVTNRELAVLRRAAEGGAVAQVSIEVDRGALTPVVTGVLPGSARSNEIWVTAHLCHPRPGANDNASGVAAALGIAAALRRNRSRTASKSIRFVFGPEFVGVAAIMHGFVTNRCDLPDGVINLDMVGENQSLCGGPFIVERSPFLTSHINALAEAVVDEVFRFRSSAHEKWDSVPFTGFSDHALFAGPAVATPAVHLCHNFDRFNHSSADSLDKVSADELVRSAVAGASIAYLLTNTDALPKTLLAQLVEQWHIREAMATERIAERYHREQDGRWSREFKEFSANRAGFGFGTSPQILPIGVDVEPILKARWQGPFNTRAMIEDMSPSTAHLVSDLVAEDKRTLSLLLNFAIRINGRRSRQQVIKETSFGLGRPIAHDKAQRLMDAMVECSWVSE